MYDCSGRRNGIDVDIKGWVVKRRVRKRPVSYNEMDVSLLPIIIDLNLTPLFLFFPFVY